MKLTFLGTGTSFGVPQLGCHCAVCQSSDPKDHRMRVAAVVEMPNGVRLLIDTPPELRLQLVAAGVDRVDAVLFTHAHADHTHGIDDIRAISARGKEPLPVYGSAETLERLRASFGYVFESNARPLPGTTKPEGHAIAFQYGEPFSAAGVQVLPLALPHGRITAAGFRIGPLAYLTDAKTVPDTVIQQLAGVRVLVVNGLFHTPHPTHLSIPEAIQVARRVGAERTYLTHLTHDNFHADLEARLPGGISPAFDGLTVTID